MGEILIFRISPRNLKQLELSGNIDPSPHSSAHPLSLSQHAAQALLNEQPRSFTAPSHSPVTPTNSCNTLSATSYQTHRDHLSAMSNSLNQTFYESRKECVAGVNSNTLNPFLPFTSKILFLPTWAQLITQTGTNRPPKGVKLPAADSQPKQSQLVE